MEFAAAKSSSMLRKKLVPWCQLFRPLSCSSVDCKELRRAVSNNKLLCGFSRHQSANKHGGADQKGCS